MVAVWTPPMPPPGERLEALPETVLLVSVILPPLKIPVLPKTEVLPDIVLLEMVKLVEESSL